MKLATMRHDKHIRLEDILMATKDFTDVRTKAEMARQIEPLPPKSKIFDLLSPNGADQQQPPNNPKSKP